jgi:hypothetical protein
LVWCFLLRETVMYGWLVFQIYKGVIVKALFIPPKYSVTPPKHKLRPDLTCIFIYFFAFYHICSVLTSTFL